MISVQEWIVVQGPIEAERFVVWSEIVYVCIPLSKVGGECTYDRQCLNTAYLLEFQT